MQYLLVLIPVSLYIFCVHESRAENALILNLKTKKLEDPKYFKQALSTPPILTACPASTNEEKLFNEKISITQNSVFLRNTHKEHENPKYIQLDICNETLKPATVYSSKKDEYLIGYELYYEEGKVTLDESEDYECLRSVHNDNNSITRKLQQDLFATKYHSFRQTKFKLIKGSTALVFHWIPILSITSTSDNRKRIHLKDTEIVKFSTDHLTDKCENHNATSESVDFFYSEENQIRNLKDISLSQSGSKNTETSCGNPYGCLEKRQMIPLWYFNSSSAKSASCTGANFVPIWKTIANGQLIKVDQYIYALTRFVLKQPDGEGELFFGVSGILKMNKTININESFEEEIHLSDANNQTFIPVPKIIYRIIHCATCVYEKAAIIIHNDPTVSDSERLCRENKEIEGWEKIKNNDRRTGLTYVCSVSKKVDDALGSRSCRNARFCETQSFSLKQFSYMWKDTREQNLEMDPNWVPTKRVQYEDIRYRVNRECDTLFDTNHCSYV